MIQDNHKFSDFQKCWSDLSNVSFYKSPGEANKIGIETSLIHIYTLE